MDHCVYRGTIVGGLPALSKCQRTWQDGGALFAPLNIDRRSILEPDNEKHLA
jgi:hypothetical protein